MADAPKAAPKPAAPAPKAAVATIEQCDVLILRGHTTSIPVTVYGYEVPVLQEIHGDESVLVTETRDVPVPEGLNAAQAYTLLETRYAQKDGEDAIRHVYRTVQSLAKESGLPYQRGDEDKVKYNQASVIVHAPVAPATGSGDVDEDQDA